MPDWLLTPPTVTLLAAFVTLAALAAIIGYLAVTADGMRCTVQAVLRSYGDHLPEHVRVRYLWHMPFTWGYPRIMHIRVPVSEVPRIRDEEQANRIGQQIRDTYEMGGARTWLRRGYRYWTITR
ncbi:hypothetical protein [Bifidobacterium aerophilum]|uniref:Uncharacterized protein n=1 Tax=Bifidobacterium aerophilum TaxID=1798155 RepID=A0A6N9Z754_9BIFI|nr:hypothetical protein [Bifidobacterium aerophilum]NEG90286.1 hypothetical protein [Bifidobacterium aerophilum]